MILLEKLAEGIQKAEGFSHNSRSFRNNNPGNLRSSPFQQTTHEGYAVFASYASGWLALLWDLLKKCSGQTQTGLTGESSVADLCIAFASLEPGAEQNNYIATVCDTAGVTSDTKLSHFLSDAQ